MRVRRVSGVPGSPSENFLAWETGRKWENRKIAPENARGGALQNRGAPESAREGAFPVVCLHGHLRRHPREHPPEHPDFGEHPGKHSQEVFWGFPISGRSPRPGRSLFQDPSEKPRCPQNRFYRHQKRLRVVTGEHWTGSPNKSIDQIGENCPKMSGNCVASPSGQFFRYFSDILSIFCGHFVDIPFFWAVQRFARYKFRDRRILVMFLVFAR